MNSNKKNQNSAYHGGFKIKLTIAVHNKNDSISILALI